MGIIMNNVKLTWDGKNDITELSPHILVEDKELSYKDRGHFSSDTDIFDNMIIQGDNLIALNSLMNDYRDKVKCIYIDPPYNTGRSFENYNDKFNHGDYLKFMRDRLIILRDLLHDSGAIFVQIDAAEQAYLKVLMDEIFGRENFLNIITVNMKNMAGAAAISGGKKIRNTTEFILVYAKSHQSIELIKDVYEYVPVSQIIEDYDQDGRSWQYTSILKNAGKKEYIGSALDGSGKEIKIFKRIDYEIKSIKKVMKEESLSEEAAYSKYIDYIFRSSLPQSSIHLRVKEKLGKNIDHDDLFSIEYVPRSGRNKDKVYEQFYKGKNLNIFAWLGDITQMINGKLCKKESIGNYWDFIRLCNSLASEGEVIFRNGKKPEKLIERIINLYTERGDIVLDSFGGSGTTAAVAHKMGRKWITIEIGDQAHSHIIPRLKRVIEYKDKGGVLKGNGGGGFKFYNLSENE